MLICLLDAMENANSLQPVAIETDIRIISLVSCDNHGRAQGQDSEPGEICTRSSNAHAENGAATECTRNINIDLSQEQAERQLSARVAEAA